MKSTTKVLFIALCFGAIGSVASGQDYGRTMAGVPGQQASVQLDYSADTDGDGFIDAITVLANGIQVVHGQTGTTSFYSYSNISFSLVTIKDTDGIPGDEIVVIWAGLPPSTANGIHVIHDRTEATKNYQQDRQFSVSFVSDADGKAGNEIIVIWAGEAPNNGIQVIHDSTGVTKNYQQNRQFGISSVSDTDGESGNEIIVYWAGDVPNNGIQVIHDKTGSTNNYQQDRQFSINKVIDTDGEAGNEIIVIWAREFPSNGIDVIHDLTQTTNKYPQNTSFSTNDVRDYDGFSGAEICISWFSGSTLYAVIVDRTRKTIATSGCDISQASRSFRTYQSGDWNDNLTWEEFIPNTGWTYPASQIPNIGHGAISIRTGHAVNIQALYVSAKQLTVDGTLQVTDTLQVAGTLNLNGTLINNGTTQVFGTVVINQNAGTASGKDFVYMGCCSRLELQNAVYNLDSNNTYWPSTNGPANVTVQGNVTLNGTGNVTSTLVVPGTLHVAGTLTTSGTTTVTGGLVVAGTLISNGTIQALTGGVEVSGKLANNGTARLNWFTIEPGGVVSGNDFIYDEDWGGTLVFKSSYTIEDSTVFWPRQNEPANVTISNSISVTLNAARAVSDILQVFGTLQVADTLTTNETSGGGTLQIDGTLIANGTTKAGTLLVAGRLTNNGTMENSWSKCQVSGLLINNGTTRSFSPYQVSGILTNNGTMQIDGTFQLDEGGVVSGNDFIYGEYGTLIFNNSSSSYDVTSASVYWPSTNGPASVRVQGAGGISMNVARAVSHFETAGSVKNASNLMVPGSVQINAGGFFDSSAVVYSGNARLTFNTGGSHEVSGEWGSGTSVGSGVPMGVTISHGTTVIMPNSPRTCPGHLYNYGTLVLSTTPGADLNVGGDWENTGTLLANSRSVIFNGTDEQPIRGGRNTFDHLAVNNPAGISIEGRPGGGEEGGEEEIDSLIVHQALTFTAGNIRLRLALLTLEGLVSGASINRHVVTYEEGRVVRAIAGDSSFQFPVGPTEMSYNPLTIALDPDDPTETFSVRVDSTIELGALSDSVCVQRTWDIREATPGDNHAALTFQWAGAEEGASFLRNSSSTYLYNGDYVEVVNNSAASGADPYIVSTLENFPITEFSRHVVATHGALTKIDESKNEKPTLFTLRQNYPNPFNPSTTISYAIPEAGHVTLKVYDLLGKEIATLVNKKQLAGEHEIRWNPVGLPSGVYFYQLKSGDFTATKKLILLH